MKNIRQIIELIAPNASNKEVAKYRTKINTYIKKYKIIYKKENNKIVLSDYEANKVVKYFKDNKPRLNNSKITDVGYVQQLEAKVKEQQKTIDQLHNQYLLKLEQQNKQLIETNETLSNKFDKLLQLMDQQQQLHGRDQVVKKQNSVEHHNNVIESAPRHWWQKLFK